MRINHKRAFYSTQAATFSYTYSGVSTESTVTYNGMEYLQVQITGSGTQTVTGRAVAQVWLCGGGASGMRPVQNGAMYGGAGGYATNGYTTVPLEDQSISVVIGSGGATRTASGFNAGSQSRFGAQTADGASSGSGGSGGGGVTDAGSGDMLSKYPFHDSVTFADRPHCAGGGGAAGNLTGYGAYSGGRGGTNGGDGSFVGKTTSAGYGAGGSYGGGRGGTAGGAGVAATFFGAGGGSGGQNGSVLGNGGAGFQGVAYFRVAAREVKK